MMGRLLMTLCGVHFEFKAAPPLPACVDWWHDEQHDIAATHGQI